MIPQATRFASFFCAALLVNQVNRATATEVTLARDGTARMPVRLVAPNERLKTLGHTLRHYLSRMSGAPFEVTASGGRGDGIVLKVARPRNLGVYDRERYSIRSHAKGLLLTGTTEDALEHAVWDLLYRLGYRQFFPGPTWEIVPRLTEMRIEIDVEEKPDYHYRSIWYGYGTWDYNRQPWEDWSRKNRMGGGLRLQTGHAYGGIIRAKQAVFDQHPEFYALIDGKRNIHPHAKLCIGNAALRRTVVEFAQEYFAKNPAADCISMEPSDGGGWCECRLCEEIGPPSDRALLLANEVADAVRPRFVGLYAYGFHSPPPTIAARPNVCVNVATAFIRGGHTLDEIISGWSAKGAIIGIREYYSVHVWDRDLPGAARGSHLDDLARTIPGFHALGARFLTAESSDNWGCNGLGYHLASRLLWDVEEADRREAIVDDFLTKCFGPAREPMERFYELIDGSNPTSTLVYEDLLARMYRALDAARKRVSADSPERRRIDQLLLYTRYVDLFNRYRQLLGPARQQAFEALIRHAYRMRRTMMVHTKALYRDLAARDRTVVVPEEARWSVPEDRNPWKSSEPFEEQELSAILRDGMDRYRPVELDFQPRTFSDHLVSAQPLKLPTAPEGHAARGRGLRSWYTRLKEPGEIVLNVTGGLIAHYRDRGNVRVRVWKLGEGRVAGERKTLVAEDRSVPPDGTPHTIRIPLKKPGLYQIDLDDGSDMTDVSWPSGQPMTWNMAWDNRLPVLVGRWSLWFYVPRGTAKIGLYVHTSAGSVLEPDGRPAFDLADKPGKFISIDVPPGADGRLWKLHQVAGKVGLMNVPPFLARSPQELLLPAETVKADAR